MTRTSRFTPHERAEIVLLGIKDSKSVSELCRKHDIAPVTYARWKKQYIAGGLEALQPGGKTNIDQLEKENRKLKLVIGELYVELEYLKKTRGWEDEATSPRRILGTALPGHKRERAEA